MYFRGVSCDPRYTSTLQITHNSGIPEAWHTLIVETHAFFGYTEWHSIYLNCAHHDKFQYFGRLIYPDCGNNCVPPSLNDNLKSISSLPLVNIVFQWFLTQVNDCETKNKYKMSHSMLTRFVFLPKTIKALGHLCINVICNLQKNHKRRNRSIREKGE